MVSASDGETLGTFGSLCQAVYDPRVARVWRIAERIEAARLIGLGDKGYTGLAEVVFLPVQRSQQAAVEAGRQLRLPQALHSR